MHQHVADTRDPEETRALGFRLGQLLVAGDVVGLTGDLGAGKTCFVQGLALGMGVAEEAYVRSPTFALIDIHPGNAFTLFHIDLYRLEHPDEATFVGYDDCFDGSGAVAVEWFDRFAELRPRGFLDVRIEIVADAERKLFARGEGERSEQLLDAWIASVGAG